MRTHRDRRARVAPHEPFRNDVVPSAKHGHRRVNPRQLDLRASTQRLKASVTATERFVLSERILGPRPVQRQIEQVVHGHLPI